MRRNNTHIRQQRFDVDHLTCSMCHDLVLSVNTKSNIRQQRHLPRFKTLIKRHHHRMRRNNTHIRQQRFDVDHLTCSMCHDPILSLNTKLGNNCLFLTMSNDKITPNKCILATNRMTIKGMASSVNIKISSSIKMSGRPVKQAFTRCHLHILQHTTSNIPMELMRSLHVLTQHTDNKCNIESCK